MDQKMILLDLEEAFGRLSDGLNVVKLMVMGLEDAADPCADRFYAVWRYLDEAGEEMRRLFGLVSNSEAGA